MRKGVLWFQEVDQGIIPQVAGDEINVVDRGGDGENSWDEQMMIASFE
jgi:hypothetical protein